MDSLKAPSKGLGNKQSSSSSSNLSNSFSIRFNANDDSLDDIYNTSSQSHLAAATASVGVASVPSVPATAGQTMTSQQITIPAQEDSIWKRDFLQTGFFSRKRSNSNENNSLSVSSAALVDSSSTPTAIVTAAAATLAPLASINVAPLDTTTWARFKGKVNQAMEDIKSSSSSTQKVGHSPANTSTADSVNASQVDSMPTTGQSSISEDYADPESGAGGGDADNSDDDVDSEIFNLVQDEGESSAVTTTTTKTSRLTRSMHRIRNNKEAIKGGLRKAKETTKDVFSRGSNSNNNNNNNKKTETGKLDASPSVAGIKKPLRDVVEIESGVEMVEDMELPAVNATAAGDPKEAAHKMASTDGSVNENNMKLRSTSAPNALQQCNTSNMEANNNNNNTKTKTSPPTASHHSLLAKYAHLLPILSSAIGGRNFAISLGLLAVLLVLPMPPFLQGVITCLFSIVAISTLYQTVCALVVAAVSHHNPLGPERQPFRVPSYDQMSVCEIPAAEEHTSLKSYSGWLNESHSYDPDNYHLGMMKTVFVKLDGTRLKVSNVANRVPKRSMWNETVVDKRQMIVTMNRVFDLRGCRVEMMPKGLARKRYFNRKYPMQLIIPNGGSVVVVGGDQEGENGGRGGAAAVGVGVENNGERSGGVSGETPEQGTPETEERFLFLNDFDSSDFGTTILAADTSTLVEQQQDQKMGQLKVPEGSVQSGNQTDTTPCSDEIRLILFARCDREKEDWYRRFQNAAIGAVRDNENPTANYKYVTDKEAQAMRQVTQSLENLTEEERQQQKDAKGPPEKTNKKENEETDETELQFPADSQFDGLLMTPCSARSHPEYVKFMAKYQSACQRKPPPKESLALTDKKSRRERKEDDLWKGIDQSLFLGPTSDVIWANVLIGRVLYSCLNDDPMLEKIQDFLQKKLSAIKLPNFMEDVHIAQLCLGDKPPLIHRVSQPLMDERGTWIDADLTYEGLVHATVTTKLNLLRLRKQQGSNGSSAAQFSQPDVMKSHKSPVSTRLQMSSIYDSDAESTGGSSSESEGSAAASSTLVVDSASSVAATIGGVPGGGGGSVEVLTGTAASAAQGSGSSSSSRKLLRIVDKITASNLFQSATEISYVQRAMENMSTRIKLRVELKGLVARVVLNIPPPPSDRIWVGFRGPPRLWITAKPALGEHSVDWSLVTNVIENKLCEEVYKFLVYPNMVDVIVPILGQSTYKEEE